MRILIKFFREQCNFLFKEHFKSIFYGASLFFSVRGKQHSHDSFLKWHIVLLAVCIGSLIKKSVDNDFF